MRDVKYLAFALMFMFSLVSVCATDVYKQGDSSNIQFTCTVNYQVPSAGATYNFSIYYPNGTNFLLNKQAQAQGQGSFNYTTIFPIGGEYTLKSFCYDPAGNFSAQEKLLVTSNGNPMPDGFVTVLFSLLYLVFFSGIIYCLIYSFGHFLKLDFDLIDLGLSYGIFFGYLTLFYLSKTYMGNASMEGIMENMMLPAGLLLLVVPLVMFVISLTVGALKPQTMDYGTRRFRRSKL